MKSNNYLFAETSGNFSSKPNNVVFAKHCKRAPLRLYKLTIFIRRFSRISTFFCTRTHFLPTSYYV